MDIPKSHDKNQFLVGYGSKYNRMWLQNKQHAEK